MTLNNIDKTEKLEYLFELFDYEMMEYIYKVLDAESSDFKYCAAALNDILTYYLEVRGSFYANSPNNLKDLFLCLSCSRSDFRRFENMLKREWKYLKAKQDLDTPDKIKYVADFLIGEYICEVLKVAGAEPEYSAVTLNNEMICYVMLS